MCLFNIHGRTLQFLCFVTVRGEAVKFPMSSVNTVKMLCVGLCRVWVRSGCWRSGSWTVMPWRWRWRTTRSHFLSIRVSCSGCGMWMGHVISTCLRGSPLSAWDTAIRKCVLGLELFQFCYFTILCCGRV